MARVLLGLVVLASLVLTAAASAAGEGGAIGARLVAEPGMPSPSPMGRISIVTKLVPGTSLRRRIEVTNTTRSVIVVTVYPAAASNDGGRFAFAAGRTPNELSRWMTVSEPTLRLAPGGRTTETVTIAVPPGASDGDRAAVVWTEIRATGSTGVELVNRVGVRVYATIGAGSTVTSATPPPPPPATPPTPTAGAPSTPAGSLLPEHLLQVGAALVLLLGGALIALAASASLRRRREAREAA